MPPGPEVKILVQEPEKHNQRKIKFSETEILISMDPTVDGSKDLHHNCLQEAIKDTYNHPVGPERTPSIMCSTLQQLLEDAIKQNFCSSTLTDQAHDTSRHSDCEDKNEDGDEVMEEAAPAMATPPLLPPEQTPTDGIGAPTPLPLKSKGGKSKKRAAASVADAQKDKPPTKRTSGNARLAHFAAMGIKKIITETQKCFGMETNATRLDKIKQAKREFRMRNDTEGASFAALYATIQICAMATSMGYDSQFLQLEPKNQRDARKWPDANLWKAAEEKELATLWGKEAFELVARRIRPPTTAVCLQTKSQGWGLRPWSTQGPMCGHGEPPV
jgi:hypothetical protein